MPRGTLQPLPELFCPVQPRVSPLRAELDADVARWMDDSHLYEQPAQLKRYIRSSFGSFAARVCPDAEREELRLFTRWLAFGFFYDDTFFDEAENHEHPSTAADAVTAVVSVLSAEGDSSQLPHRYDPDGSHRLDIAADLVRRTRSIATPEQFDRFRTQMNLWFYSYLYEPLTRQRGNGPTLPGYRVNRLHNIASLPYVTLAEIVTHCPVTAEERALPALRRLSTLAAYQMAWCNDIHSATREAHVGHQVANLPSLLRAEEGLSGEEAVAVAVRAHDDTMRDFLRVEDELRAHASPGVHACLDGLRIWMRGHYDWCRETVRYQVPPGTERGADAHDRGTEHGKEVAA